MKQLLKFCPILFFIIINCNQLSAQPGIIRGRIDSLKDEWGTPFTYTGEIKGGKPNGLGLAIYNNNTTIRYAGYFVNGKFEGKGTLLYSGGGFLSGDWKNGKSNGQATYLNNNKEMYTGSYTNGVRNGQGILIYADNGFSKGEFGNDTYNGRLVFINASGATICDNIYADGKKNGPGYQYEVENKKLFEGTWKDGTWVNATTGNYNTFLKSSSFYSEKNDNQVIAGGIDRNNKNLLEDTAFFYDLKNKKRYYGYCHNGVLTNGLIIYDDSSRFIGTLNNNGGNGPGRFLKMGQFYDEGNYVNDYLSGDNNLSIDLVKKTVYSGQMINKGEFTGKAWFSNNYNDLYSGNFVKGKFSGEGWRLDKKGNCLSGTWQDGELMVLKSLTNEKGEAINTKPKTMGEAIAIMNNMYSDDFFTLQGKIDLDENFSFFYDTYSGLVSFPGSTDNMVSDDQDGSPFYTAVYKTTADFTDAQKKYTELCNQVKAALVVVKKGTPPQKLSGDILNPDGPADFTISHFTFADTNNSLYNFAISVAIVKNKDDKYCVIILCGDKNSAAGLKE